MDTAKSAIPILPPLSPVIPGIVGPSSSVIGRLKASRTDPVGCSVHSFHPQANISTPLPRKARRTRRKIRSVHQERWGTFVGRSCGVLEGSTPKQTCMWLASLTRHGWHLRGPKPTGEGHCTFLPVFSNKSAAPLALPLVVVIRDPASQDPVVLLLSPVLH